ncbi:hypothetical protein [Deinococcus roseus]|nr:hypothetical protein [Deinococcus roseus]
MKFGLAVAVLAGVLASCAPAFTPVVYDQKKDIASLGDLKGQEVWEVVGIGEYSWYGYAFKTPSLKLLTSTSISGMKLRDFGYSKLELSVERKTTENILWVDLARNVNDPENFSEIFWGYTCRVVLPKGEVADEMAGNFTDRTSATNTNLSWDAAYDNLQNWKKGACVIRRLKPETPAEPTEPAAPATPAPTDQPPA